MGRTARRAAVGVLVVAAAAVTLIVALLLDPDPRAQAARQGDDGRAVPRATVATAPSTVLTVTPSARGRAIRPGFLGLSLEYSTVTPYAGTDPTALNPVFLQLIRNLSPGQRPQLRIGGDSTDWAWWPTPSTPRPAGIRINLSPRWLQVTSALTNSLNAEVILGIDLEADNQNLAGAEAGAFVPALGRSHVEALELGNEPELYHSFGWYQTPAGVPIPGRSAAWSFANYLRDYSTIGRALPGLPLAGPAVGAPDWMRDTPSFVSAQPRAKVISLHRYPLQECGMPAASPEFPTVHNLLATSASAGLANSVARYVSDAHAHGDTVRIDELNTVSCGGADGISDAFVSALWTVDALFQMARVGVDGVNIHTYRGAAYELFTFKRVGGTWTAYVAPQYYGMLLFGQAAPPRSHLENVAGARGPLRAWATRARDGTTRVALINDDTAHAHEVGVRASGAGGAASLERLLAPGVHATTGVTLGGRTFGSATTTGLLAGTSRTTRLSASNHLYVVRLPAASAALLTLPKP